MDSREVVGGFPVEVNRVEDGMNNGIRVSVQVWEYFIIFLQRQQIGNAKVEIGVVTWRGEQTRHNHPRRQRDGNDHSKKNEDISPTGQSTGKLRTAAHWRSHERFCLKIRPNCRDAHGSNFLSSWCRCFRQTHDRFCQTETTLRTARRAGGELSHEIW